MTTSWTRRKFLSTAAGATAAALAPPRLARPAETSDPFVRLDATAQAALVRRGEVTPLELVDAAIARIERLNPVLNAFVTTCFERARDQARVELPDGPFRGVPYAIKDLSDYEGERTTMGSRLFEDNVSRKNNGIVERALEAGLVILGKTNTPEFGLLATTESLLLGPARNPWNLDHSTAGSSGGSAAAVASGMLPFAQASDGGGSIRNPASACGVFGLKPSRNRIFALGDPLPGDIAVRFTVSRSVRDSARLLAVSERRGDDARIAPVGVVEGPSKRRLKIGFTTRNGIGEEAHPAVKAALEETASLCESLGHTVVPASYPANGEEFTYHFLSVWSSLPAEVVSWARVIGLTQLRWVGPDDVLEPWTLGLAEMYEKRGGERTLLELAYELEQARPWADRWPPNSAL